MTAINHELRKKIESAAHPNLEGIHPFSALHQLLIQRSRYALHYLNGRDDPRKNSEDVEQCIDYCNEQIKALLGI